MAADMRKIESLPVLSVSLNSTFAQILNRDFSMHANRRIEDINALISLCNRLPITSQDKLVKLYEINDLRKKLEDEYPQDIIIPAFTNEIENKLFEDLKKQFAEFNISMHEQSLAENHPLHPRSVLAPINPFARMLANMDPEDGRRMLAILSDGSSYDNVKFLELFKTSNPEYNQIINAHENKYLGGGNSKNYALTSRITPNPYAFAVRVDNRLGGAREMDTYLRNSSLAEIVTPIEAVRSLTFDGITNTLLITSVCPGGTPEAHSKRSANTKDRLKGALDIYSQMGSILSKINKENILFPDAKNSNWLLDSQGKLVLSDTKALVFSDKGFFDFSSTYQKNKWIYGSSPHLVITPHYSPPEINKERFNVDQMHSFILGKNLYQYLTQCNTQYLDKKQDASSLNFDSFIFKTGVGPELKKLIAMMIVSDPQQRIAVADAVKQLKTLATNLAPVPVMNKESVVDTRKANCKKTLLGIQSHPNDNEMQAFLTKMNDAIDRANSHDLVRLEKIIDRVKKQQPITTKFVEATKVLIGNSNWKWGGNKKAAAIEKAVYNIPVMERVNMLTDNTSSEKIQNLHSALGTWRTILGNFAPRSLLSNTIFKKYKDRYEAIKKDEDKPNIEKVDPRSPSI